MGPCLTRPVAAIIRIAMAAGPGDHIGEFDLLELLGIGGMGEVWLARDSRLGRKVAVKLLPASLTDDPVRVSRFEQEARAASALSHPNVCHIYTLGKTEEGQRYIAMELVEGQTLRARLLAGPVPTAEALRLGTQLAAALTAAHACGIVHRDLKPENVMIRADGLVKVLDFGLAKLALAGGDASGDDATRTVQYTDPGTVVGTVAYMSPEQSRGLSVDIRTDVWSVGVILYELVAGRRPFEGESRTDVLAAILEHEPAALARFEPNVPGELQRIVTKALRKDRGQRYQSMADLQLDLEALRHSLEVSSAPGGGAAGPTGDSGATGGQLLPAPASARGRRLAPIAIAVVAIAGAFAVWWLVRVRSPGVAVERPSAVQRELTRLTFEPGLQTQPTFSPDGRFIAYVADTAGNLDIWVRPVAGGDPVRVTRSPAADTQPNWSPDGSRIAFQSEREGGGIYAVHALGGAETRLAHFGTQPRWAPDGQYVGFTGPLGVDSRALPRLYVVGADGVPARQVLNKFTDGIFAESWDWHPSGKVTFFGVDRGFKTVGYFTQTLAGDSPDVLVDMYKATAWRVHVEP